MGDIKDISRHPGYRPPEATGLVLEEDDTSIPVISNRPVPICSRCVYSVDRRPWWDRLLGRHERFSLHCQLKTREKTTSFVTGEILYIPDGLSSPMYVSEEPYERCSDANLLGDCTLFRSKHPF